MLVNIPDIREEVLQAFNEYEAALMRNDVDALINKFWCSAEAVRFGANETLYGWDAIVNFRQNREPPAKRELFNTIITSFGNDYANISTEFRRSDGAGRQSQSWIRTENGWRIAMAHISFNKA